MGSRIDHADEPVVSAAGLAATTLDLDDDLRLRV